MAVTGERITYSGPKGPMATYLTKPEGNGPWPGLIVIQEVFGLESHIKEMARRFAAEGVPVVGARSLLPRREAQNRSPKEAIGSAMPIRYARPGGLHPEPGRGSRRDRLLHGRRAVR